MAKVSNPDKLKIKIKKKGELIVGMEVNGIDISKHVLGFSFEENYSVSGGSNKLGLSLTNCDIETEQI